VSPLSPTGVSCWHDTLSPAGTPVSVVCPRASRHAADALACGNDNRATVVRQQPGTAALGTCTTGRGLEPDHGHALDVRALRQAPRAASPVHGPARRPRPGTPRTVVHLPVMRQAGTEPAHAHLQHPLGLPPAESRPETSGAGRRAETQAEGRSCPQAGAGQGTPAQGSRTPQAASRRGRSQTENSSTRPVARPRAARLRDLHRPVLHPVRVPGLPRRQGSRPCRGRSGRLRRGVRRGHVRPVRRSW